MEIDWVDIILKLGAIGIPSFVAWWIGNKIQKKLDTEKSLRNHMVNEILEVRNTYRRLVDSVRTGALTPREIKSELSVMSTHITDLMNLIKKRDETVSKDFLLPYQLEFSQLITDDSNYIKHFEKNEVFQITENTNSSLSSFEKNYHHLFNDLILLIFK